MTFIGKISKGHNAVKNLGGVTVLVLCSSPDNGSYCSLPDNGSYSYKVS